MVDLLAFPVFAGASTPSPGEPPLWPSRPPAPARTDLWPPGGSASARPARYSSPRGRRTGRWSRCRCGALSSLTCRVANAVPIPPRVVTAALALILTVGAAPAGQAAEYVIDPAHSFIQFRTQHLGISWLAGRFNRFEGSMVYDPEAGPDAQAISITINARSLDTNHAERDKHLRGAFFFNVEAYPTVTFVSTGFAGGPEGGKLTGDLTFLGVTKSIWFDVRLIGEGDDPWGVTAPASKARMSSSVGTSAWSTTSVRPPRMSRST